MSTLARAPDRSSPHQVARSSLGCSRTYSPSDVTAKLVLALLRVGGGDHAPQPGLRQQVVGAVHQQHAAARERGGPELGVVTPRPGDELLGLGGDVASVGVRAVEVLGPHGRSVGCAPPEAGLGDLARHTSPHHRVLESGEAQDLGHLRDVPEHVGQVTDLRGSSPMAASPPRAAARANPCCRFRTIVSPDTMNSSMRIIHGPTWRRPAPASARTRCSWCGAHLEVVVDDRGLAVEEEPGERLIGLQQVEEVVDQVHQLHPVALERGVPLPVPVGVGDDPDGSHRLRIRAGHPSRSGCQEDRQVRVALRSPSRGKRETALP